MKKIFCVGLFASLAFLQSSAVFADSKFFTCAVEPMDSAFKIHPVTLLEAYAMVKKQGADPMAPFVKVPLNVKTQTNDLIGSGFQTESFSALAPVEVALKGTTDSGAYFIASYLPTKIGYQIVISLKESQKPGARKLLRLDTDSDVEVSGLGNGDEKVNFNCYVETQ